MKKVTPPVVPGKLYKHYKGGRYLVLAITEESTDERAGEFGVVYISLTYGKIWHRELSQFTEKVKWLDGKLRSRFLLEK